MLNDYTVSARAQSLNAVVHQPLLAGKILTTDALEHLAKHESTPVLHS